MDSLESFFTEITNKPVIKGDDEWCKLIYVFASEFGWTQRDLEEIEIPYMIDVLKGRKLVFKEQERMSKR